MAEKPSMRPVIHPSTHPEHTNSGGSSSSNNLTQLLKEKAEHVKNEIKLIFERLEDRLHGAS